MPTAYTADVATGRVTSLREFALICARGMGALVMMRDEPFSAPIPERFEPSSFYRDAMASAKSELSRILAMSEAEADAAADLAHQEAETYRFDALKRDEEEAARYDAMIAQVEAWEGAPEGLKPFMLEQLRQSRNFDCYTPEQAARYYPEPVRQTGAEWKAARKAALLRSIEQSAEGWRAELIRTDDRNAWLAQLRRSLPAEPVAEAMKEIGNG